jgi:hypothetical protein
MYFSNILYFWGGQDPNRPPPCLRHCAWEEKLLGERKNVLANIVLQENKLDTWD